MAKPLDERIAAAMGANARAATVAGLTAELADVISTTQAQHDELDRQSKSASVSEEAAEAAGDAASKLARRLVRLKAKHEQLAERHAELLNSESRQRRLAEQQAALDHRDQLAIEIRERWPTLVSEMTSILARIEESDREIAASGSHIASSEAIAREAPANWYHNGTPIRRLTRANIPAFSLADATTGDGLAWPDSRPVRAERMRLEEQARRHMLGSQRPASR